MQQTSNVTGYVFQYKNFSPKFQLKASSTRFLLQSLLKKQRPKKKKSTPPEHLLYEGSYFSSPRPVSRGWSRRPLLFLSSLFFHLSHERLALPDATPAPRRPRPPYLAVLEDGSHLVELERLPPGQHQAPQALLDLLESAARQAASQPHERRLDCLPTSPAMPRTAPPSPPPPPLPKLILARRKKTAGHTDFCTDAGARRRARIRRRRGHGKRATGDPSSESRESRRPLE